MALRRRLFFTLIGAGAMSTMLLAGLGRTFEVSKAKLTPPKSKLMAVRAAKAKLRKGPCWMV